MQTALWILDNMALTPKIYFSSPNLSLERNKIFIILL